MTMAAIEELLRLKSMFKQCIPVSCTIFPSLAYRGNIGYTKMLVQTANNQTPVFGPTLQVFWWNITKNFGLGWSKKKLQRRNSI